MPSKKALRLRISEHLAECGIVGVPSLLSPFRTKETYRSAHLSQRSEKVHRNKRFLTENSTRLIRYIANGSDIEPPKISPRLILVRGGTLEANIFRFASLYWSIPVSEGYGRRLRFLVVDEFNGKLIGILGLGDAVFNLRARDDYIGWNSDQRKDHLVSLMDAYVVGAMPPYNQLLGGKLIASLVKTTDIASVFREKYKERTGIISNQKKNPYLAAVTVTSALGRSSLYNRLKLQNYRLFDYLGDTGGWGHFHFPDDIFRDLCSLIERSSTGVSKSYSYGQGPNWRMRTIRAGLSTLGIDADLLNHGFKRELYFCELATNAKDILLGRRKRPKYESLKSATEVSALAMNRWVLPRSQRNFEYSVYQRESFLDTLKCNSQ